MRRSAHRKPFVGVSCDEIAPVCVFHRQGLRACSGRPGLSLVFACGRAVVREDRWATGLPCQLEETAMKG